MFCAAKQKSRKKSTVKLFNSKNEQRCLSSYRKFCCLKVAWHNGTYWRVFLYFWISTYTFPLQECCEDIFCTLLRAFTSKFPFWGAFVYPLHILEPLDAWVQHWGFFGPYCTVDFLLDFCFAAQNMLRHWFQQ